MSEFLMVANIVLLVINGSILWVALSFIRELNEYRKSEMQKVLDKLHNNRG